MIRNGLVGRSKILCIMHVSSVADPEPDPGSGAFLTPGSGIWNRFFPDRGSRISDPGPQTHILRA
jgi:hypothetical protein